MKLSAIYRRKHVGGTLPAVLSICSDYHDIAINGDFSAKIIIHSWICGFQLETLVAGGQRKHVDGPTASEIVVVCISTNYHVIARNGYTIAKVVATTAPCGLKLANLFARRRRKDVDRPNLGSTVGTDQDGIAGNGDTPTKPISCNTVCGHELNFIKLTMEVPGIGRLLRIVVGAKIVNPGRLPESTFTSFD